jgi:hypothetical protein
MLEGNKDSNTNFVIKNTTTYSLLSLKKVVEKTKQQCYLDLQPVGSKPLTISTEFVFPLDTHYSISGGVGDCVKTEKNFVCKCAIGKDHKYCAIAVENKLDSNDSCDLGVGSINLSMA